MKSHISQAFGLIAFCIAAAFTATTSYALFVAESNVAGIGFQTKTVDLQVSTEDNTQMPSQFSTQAQFIGVNVVFPGMEPISRPFWVINNSASGRSFRIFSQFSPGDTDWDQLKAVLQVNIHDTETGEESGWKSLEEWMTPANVFPNPVLRAHHFRKYEFQYKMLANYPYDPDGPGVLQMGSPIGSELFGKSTNGMLFTLEGDYAE